MSGMGVEFYTSIRIQRFCLRRVWSFVFRIVVTVFARCCSFDCVLTFSCRAGAVFDIGTRRCVVDRDVFLGFERLCRCCSRILVY